MKPVVFLWLLACLPAEAGLIASFHTSRGTVTASLLHETAPQAVANFITLAEGTRAWVDPRDGSVRKQPYYNGTVIHRTSNNSLFKFAQGGSILGNGSDGPGYTFKDELPAAVIHEPYSLSMANAGPNTNGGQFFFTGGLAHPAYDGVHPVIGRVEDATSRTVVDAMISGGPGTTTIHSISFERTDAAAAAFNEHAQGLPEVSQPAGSLAVQPAVSAVWTLTEPITVGTTFRVFRSASLAAGSWTELPTARRHVGFGSTPPPTPANTLLDDASLPKAFYHLSLARHPAALAPASLAESLLLLDFSGTTVIYQFNADASGGTVYLNPGSPAETAVPFDQAYFNSGAHHLMTIVHHPDLNPKILRIVVGCDSVTTSQINARHSTAIPDGQGDWNLFARGAAVLIP